MARAIYRHVKESATQRLLLEKGDIDIARNLSPQDLAAVAANTKDIKLTNVLKGTVYYISLNQKNANLARPEVREAFKWLVDYDAIGATLIKDIGVVNQNFLPQGLLGASREKPYKLDVDKARALLAKAGLPNGFKVTMDVRTVQPVQGIAEAFQQTARRAGIEIEILPGDGKQVLTRTAPASTTSTSGDWGADYWDPHTNADTFARNPDNGDDAKLKPVSWRNGWAIPELTKKADAALLERDTAKRARLYDEIQAEFPQDQPLRDALPAAAGGGAAGQCGRLQARPDQRFDAGGDGDQALIKSCLNFGVSVPADLPRPARRHLPDRPGDSVDPVLAVVGDKASEEQVARAREELGLNKPLLAHSACTSARWRRAISAPRC